jgi:hypothetical protein
MARLMQIIRPYENKVLMPVPKAQWRTPSRAQEKDQFGNENQTRFRVRLRLNDGKVKWQGWLDDREDFDAYLWAIVQQQEHGFPIDIGHLINEQWGDPEWWPGLEYDFATQVFLTTPTNTLLTYTIPVDWVSSANNIQTLSGGGSGGVVRQTTAAGGASGGGGGGWAQILNFSATPGDGIQYQIGVGGVSKTRSTNGATSGGDATETWFNGTTITGSSVGSGAGQGGGAATGGTIANGTPGGSASHPSVGTNKNAGGTGRGNMPSPSPGGASGGGGAGGPNGVGSDSTAVSGGVTAGGYGDAGYGGVGGAAGGGNGGNGSEWDASHGSGAGGGAAQATASNATSGTGGNYGGASGGVYITNGGTGTSAAGGQGILYVVYTPIATVLPGFNMPMMGM